MIDGTSERVHHTAVIKKKATWIVVSDESGELLDDMQVGEMLLADKA